MRLTTLLLSLPFLMLTACGAGESGRDEIQPPIITNANTLVVQKTLATTPSDPGTEIHGEGINPDAPTGNCGHILRFNGYRDDTHIYFRIEEALGFCWGTDIYYIVIEDVRWRGIPGTILLSNVGNPANGGSGEGSFILKGSGARSLDTDLDPTQFKDNPDDTWFWLKLPLDLFNFVSDPVDANSTFNTWVLIRRLGTDGQFTDLDWTAEIHVDYVKPS